MKSLVNQVFIELQLITQFISIVRECGIFTFYPTALKGCRGIVFTHGVRMGGRPGGRLGGRAGGK